VNWLRLYSEARNDRKLASFTDAEFRVWFNLLCMAGESRQRGTVAYDDLDLLALETANGDVELLAATLAKMTRLKMVSGDGQTITFLHWDDRQYDKPSDAPDATRERKQRSRDKARQGRDDTPVTPMSRDVTPGHATYTENKQNREEQTISPPSVPPKGESAPRGSRIPDDFAIDDELRTWAAGKGFSPPEIEHHTEAFVKYWRGEAGQKARKSNWRDAWQNWLLRETPGKWPGAPPRPIAINGKHPPSPPILQPGQVPRDGGLAEYKARRAAG